MALVYAKVWRDFGGLVLVYGLVARDFNGLVLVYVLIPRDFDGMVLVFGLVPRDYANTDLPFYLKTKQKRYQVSLIPFPYAVFFHSEISSSKGISLFLALTAATKKVTTNATVMIAAPI